MSAPRQSNFRQCLRISLGLFALTVLLYSPAAHFDFVNFDDPYFVTNNPLVLAGLTWNGAVQAFKATVAANWHPLTLLSHMLDCQIYGTEAGGHHATNILLHAAATVFLFLALRALTGALWRCAVVAALFAWHPMHVESVAWIAERKDVLSAVFFTLILWAYASYVREGNSRKFYVLTLALFAAGLMSKPMLVTTPFILLLLDYWPLARISNWRRVLAEKIPFFALSIASCAITLWTQQKASAISSTTEVPLLPRLGNAAVAIATYVAKLFWPFPMAAFYPFPNSLPLARFLPPILLLAVISIGVMRYRREKPWLVMGWLWFLGMLVPVIGLVKVGAQSMADRFTYLPYIGLFIVITWGVSEWRASHSGSQAGRILPPAATGLALAACLAGTTHQLQYWRDTPVLFEHALAVTSGNYAACDNLANYIVDTGRYNENARCFPERPSPLPRYYIIQDNLRAILAREGILAQAERDCATALRSEPASVTFHINLGDVLFAEGKLDDAMAHYEAALQFQPRNQEARARVAGLRDRKSELSRALALYYDAIRALPGKADLYNNAGDAWACENQLDRAALFCQKAIQLDPKCLRAHRNLGNIYHLQHRYTEAAGELKAALSLDSDDVVVQSQLANTLDKIGKPSESLALSRQIIKSEPNNAQAHFELAYACASLGKFDEAVSELKEALRLAPGTLPCLNNLAWILATCPQDRVRNGPEAVRLAATVCNLTGQRDPGCLDTLAAAEAAAGHFDEAVRTADGAIKLATAAGDGQLAGDVARRLALYRQDKIFIDAPSVQ